MSAREEGGLSRWSRRKSEAKDKDRRNEPATEADAAGEQAAPDSAAADPNASTTPEVRVEDLPDIETLTYESDFTMFLQEGVPDFLRRQALQKLWRSSPVLANLDGLNDYEPGNLPFIKGGGQVASALQEAAQSVEGNQPPPEPASEPTATAGEPGEVPPSPEETGDEDEDPGPPEELAGQDPSPERDG